MSQERHSGRELTMNELIVDPIVIALLRADDETKRIGAQV